MAFNPRNHETPIFHLLVVVLSLGFIVSSALTDSEILLKFKGSLSNASGLTSWVDKTVPCKGDVANWEGVICVNGSTRGLQLENMGLKGKIDVDVLKDLRYLMTLSFMNNEFDGPMPEFNKLGALRSVYLSNNHLSGEIPSDAFKGMDKIMKVHLANNAFSGSIPSSLATLKMLMELRLEGNQFSGEIPDFSQKFKSFNVSNNALKGSIPTSLSNMDLGAFSGNKDLCGQPLNECDNPKSNSDAEAKGTKKLPTFAIVIIAIVAALVLAGILAAVLMLMCRRKNERTPTSMESPPPSNLQKKTGLRDPNESPSSSPDHSGSGRRGEAGKLSFIREDMEKFDLQDLLKASAEVLGSGCFGSSYKAALPNGQMMVVKRFKQMNNVAKEEFHEHMRRLGRLSHENLLSLVAFYYRKEEKLLISNFVEKRSLAVHLHGHQALGQPGLDWQTRLNIVKGVTKGLSYLCKELPSLIAVHGHLKSSNVLLDESYNPLLTDFGLIPVINQEAAEELMVAYKSPEYTQHGRITKKTDVWCLGILILEILTGKLPVNFLPQGKGNKEEDLATWVNSIPEEEWTSKVFDKEIAETESNEGEMLKLLKIGLSCCEVDVDRRLDMKEVVESLNELKAE